MNIDAWNDNMEIGMMRETNQGDDEGGACQSSKISSDKTNPSNSLARAFKIISRLRRGKKATAELEEDDTSISASSSTWTRAAASGNSSSTSTMNDSYATTSRYNEDSINKEFNKNEEDKDKDRSGQGRDRQEGTVIRRPRGHHQPSKGRRARKKIRHTTTKPWSEEDSNHSSYSTIFEDLGSLLYSDCASPRKELAKTSPDDDDDKRGSQ
jgi:hypothetical protein